MTTAHDPLCPAPLCDWTGKAGADCMGYEDCPHDCQCNLIVQVREEERMRDDDYAYVATQSYATALRDAVEAVQGVYCKTDSGEILRQGGTWENALDRAIAAIENLDNRSTI